MEKYKLLRPDCLWKGECYQQYDRDGSEYCTIVKIGNPSIYISYWNQSPSIGIDNFPENYLYAKISEHSFNRIKRIVMKKLGI